MFCLWQKIETKQISYHEPWASCAAWVMGIPLKIMIIHVQSNSENYRSPSSQINKKTNTSIFHLRSALFCLFNCFLFFSTKKVHYLSQKCVFSLQEVVVLPHPHPGSNLDLKKYIFFYMMFNVKGFFWMENFRFQNSCRPPLSGRSLLENFLAAPLPRSAINRLLS